MKVAIPTWSGRVSPVFDAAKCLTMAEIDGGALVGREQVAIDEIDPAARARRVKQLGVDVLICCGISGPLEALLASTGVWVIPQTCGPADDVLRAFATGRLTDRAFLMPGCRGRRRRFRERYRGNRWMLDGRQDRHDGDPSVGGAATR